MSGFLYPVLDLDKATPDELRRHARDLHHRISTLVKVLDTYESEVRELKNENAALRAQRLSLLEKR